MNKISAFVVAASVVLASSSAFAGGMVEPEPEPTPVVVDGGSSSVSPLWLLLPLAIGYIGGPYRLEAGMAEAEREEGNLLQDAGEHVEEGIAEAEDDRGTEDGDVEFALRNLGRTPLPWSASAS